MDPVRRPVGHYRTEYTASESGSVSALFIWVRQRLRLALCNGSNWIVTPHLPHEIESIPNALNDVFCSKY
jgi:hypothetical protein